jgi:hypothetical protein
MAVLAAALIGSGGCRPELETEYGQLRAPNGKESIQGFAAFGDAIEQRGFRMRQVSAVRATPCEEELIVWAPLQPGMPTAASMDWFGSFFLTGGPRTLVFIYRCDDMTASYWHRTRVMADPTDRWEFRRKAAEADLSWMAAEFGEVASDSRGHAWARIEPRPHAMEAVRWSGPWAASVGDSLPLVLEAAVRMEPAVADVSVGRATAPVTPSDESSETNPTTDPESSWQRSAESEAAQHDPPRFTPLLIDDQGAVVAAELTAERWEGGRVIVIAGAGFLCNVGLADPRRRGFAVQLLDSLEPSIERARGLFLATPTSDLQIREYEQPVLAGQRFRLLRVWPIGVVLLFLILLGLCAVLALWPSLGRPRPLPGLPQGDFGMHVAAIATLLQRNRADEYARRRIADYQSLMHAESRRLGDEAAVNSSPRADANTKTGSEHL